MKQIRIIYIYIRAVFLTEMTCERTRPAWYIKQSLPLQVWPVWHNLWLINAASSNSNYSCWGSSSSSRAKYQTSVTKALWKKKKKHNGPDDPDVKKSTDRTDLKKHITDLLANENYSKTMTWIVWSAGTSFCTRSFHLVPRQACAALQTPFWTTLENTVHLVEKHKAKIGKVYHCWNFWTSFCLPIFMAKSGQVTTTHCEAATITCLFITLWHLVAPIDLLSKTLAKNLCSPSLVEPVGEQNNIGYFCHILAKRCCRDIQIYTDKPPIYMFDFFQNNISKISKYWICQHYVQFQSCLGPKFERVCFVEACAVSLVETLLLQLSFLARWEQNAIDLIWRFAWVLLHCLHSTKCHKLSANLCKREPWQHWNWRSRS